MNYGDLGGKPENEKYSWDKSYKINNHNPSETKEPNYNATSNPKYISDYSTSYTSTIPYSTSPTPQKPQEASSYSSYSYQNYNLKTFSPPQDPVSAPSSNSPQPNTDPTDPNDPTDPSDMLKLSHVSTTSFSLQSW